MIRSLTSTMTPPYLPEADVVTPRVDARTRRWWQQLWSGVDWVFGFVAVMVGVAILSVIPILNLLSLGYLLEASGRVARTGRLRDGFVGVRKASLLGSLVICGGVAMLPTMFAYGMWRDAQIIAPGGQTETFWLGLTLVFGVIATGHLCWAMIRGGRIRHFLWPAPIRFLRWLRSPGKYVAVRDGCLDYLIGLRLHHYFWLGFRGFVGAVIWLAAPVSVLVLGSTIANDLGSLSISFAGGCLLMVAVSYLPFLQTNFAATGRFKSLFAVGGVRRQFRRAPLAYWSALFLTLLFALPLYLAKIELAPRELAWIPSLIFVAFIFPARLIAGWAVSRAEKREEPQHLVYCWIGRLGAIPVLAAYAFFVYLMQYLSWHGSWGMLEQHAFLVPTPMLSM